MPTITVGAPMTTVEGGPTHTAISLALACGIEPTRTVNDPRVIGPPTWGIGGIPGITIGHTC
jgi:hypothetical protein